VIGTDGNGCSNTDRVVVSLKYKVTGIVGEGGQICQGEFIKLKASGAHRYEWSPAGAIDNSTSAEPIASPQATTIFRVVAFEGSCIPDTDFVDVTVHPKPTVKAYGSATIVAGNDAPLNAEGDLIKTFLWKPSENLDCSDCPNPIAKPINTTTYTVIVSSAYGCQDSDQVVVRVQCDASQLFIPNTFTPNGDGQNDVFYPRGVGFTRLRSFRVFNRWGEIVYERRNFPLNDKTFGWDGTFKGGQLPPDVFMYTIEADCEDNEVLLWKGDVTIIR
jgi:gliding motility-associated-like protein